MKDRVCFDSLCNSLRGPSITTQTRRVGGLTVKLSPFVDRYKAPGSNFKLLVLGITFSLGIIKIGTFSTKFL